MKNIIFCLLVVMGLVSCNIYSPFAQKGSTEDLVEEGQKCLHDGDFGCAIEAYSAITNLEIKSFKLCSAYLAQAGMTLTMLTTTVTQNNTKMLGALAQAYVPWTAAKSEALDNAKTHCGNFAVAASTANAVKQAAVLKTLSFMSHCAVRIAKTDLYVATSNADTTCTTAGNANGVVTQSDVSDTAGGAITATGMCTADVTSCNDDFTAIDGAGLSNAGANDMKTALDQVPAALRTSGGTTAVRGAIRDSI